jgi:aminoglycoside phosphotransferase (APT) family kinase protein
LEEYDLSNDGIEDTIPVREEEVFDYGTVQNYLTGKLPDIPNETMRVRQFPSGASNLTYLLRFGPSWEAVLRRPPFGPVAPTAHNMKREFVILSKLHPVFPLAPQPYFFCDDAQVIGAPFYVMERRRGIVLNDKIPASVQFNEEMARRISELCVHTLVNLHSIDWKASGFGEIAHPEGFLDRQVRGWMKRYDMSKTEDVPEMTRLITWFPKNIPRSTSDQATVIHNDFKLNNVMLDNKLQEFVAVFDWEMATIGDPLFDLGVAMSYWFEPSDPQDLREGLRTVTTLPGFYSRKQFIDHYIQLSGREIKNIEFYLAFAYFKLAIINQQIYFRWKNGQTHDSRFAGLGAFTRVVARQGLNLIN